MQQRTTRVNASEETIKIGPLGIRFLLTGDDSSGSVSVFEVLVPVGQKLAAPAHKNDAYEKRTVRRASLEKRPDDSRWHQVTPPGAYSLLRVCVCVQ